MTRTTIIETHSLKSQGFPHVSFDDDEGMDSHLSNQSHYGAHSTPMPYGDLYDATQQPAEGGVGSEQQQKAIQ